MAEKKSSTTTKKTTGAATTAKAAKPATAAKKGNGKSAAPKTTAPRTNKGAAAANTKSVSEEMRQVMIREAAYYRALNRGFGTGAELEDWVVAEQEINSMLGRLTA